MRLYLAPPVFWDPGTPSVLVTTLGRWYSASVISFIWAYPSIGIHSIPCAKVIGAKSCRRRKPANSAAASSSNLELPPFMPVYERPSLEDQGELTEGHEL